MKRLLTISALLALLSVPVAAADMHVVRLEPLSNCSPVPVPSFIGNPTASTWSIRTITLTEIPPIASEAHTITAEVWVDGNRPAAELWMGPLRITPQSQSLTLGDPGLRLGPGEWLTLFTACTTAKSSQAYTVGWVMYYVSE